MPIDTWMDKEDVVYIYNGILAIKGWNNAICNNMDGPRDKPNRERQIYSITYI